MSEPARNTDVASESAERRREYDYEIEALLERLDGTAFNDPERWRAVLLSQAADGIRALLARIRAPITEAVAWRYKSKAKNAKWTVQKNKPAHSFVADCEVEPLVAHPLPQGEAEPAEADQLALYRDIFAEITAKATPLEFAPDDPERIIAYRIPCGPLHRAAGKIGFQMFDGERYLKEATAKIAELEAKLRHSGDGVEDWT